MDPKSTFALPTARLRRRTALLAAFCLALAVGVATPVAPPPAGAADQADACQFTRDKTAAPPEIRLGESVTVTLKVDGTCPARDNLADVMLVIDRSQSMYGSKWTAAKRAAITFVDNTSPDLVHIGLIAFASVAVNVNQPTSDHDLLKANINNLQLERGTNLVDSLEFGRRMAIGGATRPGASKVIILLTDGRHTLQNPSKADIDPVVANVRAAGIIVYAIGLGTDLDEAFLRKIATDANHFLRSPTESQLEPIFLSLASSVKALVLQKSATLVDQVPANMTYLPGTAQPIAPLVSADGRTLTWNLANVQAPGYELSYQLRPHEPGTWPTNVRAHEDYTDGLGQKGSIEFPVPTVKVIANPSQAKCVCNIARQRAPAWLIDDAMLHPERYYGWQYLLDPGKPPGPMNPRRECLTLLNPNVDWHPFFNSVVWRVGCYDGRP